MGKCVAISPHSTHSFSPFLYSESVAIDLPPPYGYNRSRQNWFICSVGTLHISGVVASIAQANRANKIRPTAILRLINFASVFTLSLLSVAPLATSRTLPNFPDFFYFSAFSFSRACRLASASNSAKLLKSCSKASQFCANTVPFFSSFLRLDFPACFRRPSVPSTALSGKNFIASFYQLPCSFSTIIFSPLYIDGEKGTPLRAPPFLLTRCECLVSPSLSFYLCLY